MNMNSKEVMRAERFQLGDLVGIAVAFERRN
jgi:hypothetical protein